MPRILDAALYTSLGVTESGSLSTETLSLFVWSPKTTDTVEVGQDLLKGTLWKSDGEPGRLRVVDDIFVGKMNYRKQVELRHCITSQDGRAIISPIHQSSLVKKNL